MKKFSASVIVTRAWGVVVMCFLLFSPNNTALASMVEYVFQAESSGVILATLTLSGDGPYYHTDVVEMTFTANGNAILGFGEGKYTGVFDGYWNAPAAPVGYGLGTGDFPTTGPSTFFDTDPPPAFDGFIPSYLAVRFRNRSGGDEIEYNGPVGTRVGSYGDWRIKSQTLPIPEPCTMLLLGCGLIGLAGYSKLRKK